MENDININWFHYKSNWKKINLKWLHFKIIKKNPSGNIWNITIFNATTKKKIKVSSVILSYFCCENSFEWEFVMGKPKINRNTQYGYGIWINNSLPDIDWNSPESSIYTIKNTWTTLKENDILVAPVIRNPKFLLSNEVRTKQIPIKSSYSLSHI